MGYSFLLATRVLLYASSHREDSTYHGLCYTSREMAECVHHGGSIRRPIAPWANALTTESKTDISNNWRMSQDSMLESLMDISTKINASNKKIPYVKHICFRVLKIVSQIHFVLQKEKTHQQQKRRTPPHPPPQKKKTTTTNKQKKQQQKTTTPKQQNNPHKQSNQYTWA